MYMANKTLPFQAPRLCRLLVSASSAMAPVVGAASRGASLVKPGVSGLVSEVFLLRLPASFRLVLSRMAATLSTSPAL